MNNFDDNSITDYLNFLSNQAPSLPKLRHYKLKLLKELLCRSTREHAGICVVANAGREQIPRAYSVDVKDGHISFTIGSDPDNPSDTDPPVRYKYPLPGILLAVVEDFDEQLPDGTFRYSVNDIIKKWGDEKGVIVGRLDARQASNKWSVKKGPTTKIKKKTKKTKKTIKACRAISRRRHGKSFVYTRKISQLSQ